jgi:hypothetical protein
MMYTLRNALQQERTLDRLHELMDQRGEVERWKKFGIKSPD